MFNPTQFMQVYQQFRQNPLSLLGRRFNIPQGMNSPQDIIQHLLNSGQVSQDQVNRAMSMRNDPQIRQLFR